MVSAFAEATPEDRGRLVATLAAALGYADEGTPLRFPLVSNVVTTRSPTSA